MSVIANTTVISNFACIGQLELLRQLHGKIYLAMEVYQEIQTGLAEGYLFYQTLEEQIYPWQETGWIILTSMVEEAEFLRFSELPAKLHPGEASSLVIAQQRGWLFLTDDLAARTQAKQRGVRLSGSLGELVLAVKRQHCSLEQANQWLNRMIELNYRSPVNDLTALLQ